MKKLLIIPLMAGISLPSLALQPLGDEAGFSGAVNLGVGGGEMESNFLAQIDGINIDLSSEKIDSFDSPDAENLTMPVTNFDLGYTLANKKTRFSIGNDLNDFIEFDSTTRLSVRHDFDSLGSMRLDGLMPPTFATKVYEDPYQTGVKRRNTDMEASGARITWDKIMGSNFEVKLSVLNRDVDDERSGVALGLSKPERDLLERDGDVMRFEVGYMFKLNNRHMLRPSVTFVDRDLDGDAMSQDGGVIALQHMYRTKGMEWATQVQYSSLSGDKENPIFGDKNDADIYGISSIMSFPGSIGFLGKWTPNIGVNYADSDSDIDFNDSSVWMVSAALSRKF